MVDRNLLVILTDGGESFMAVKSWHSDPTESYVDRLKLTVTVSTKRSGFPFKSSGE
jgi:hypothetical protein